MLSSKLKEFVEYAWLNLGDEKEFGELKVKNPLDKLFSKPNPTLEVIRLMRNPKYFGFTCKYLLNKELHPFQLAILQELWVRPFPMLIGARGSSKSFSLGLYSLLRSIFNQGTKVVVVGAAFRQAKFVFDVVEDIWSGAPLLKDFLGQGTRSRPHRPVRANDLCYMWIGNSIIRAIPIGTGEKVRGYRGNVIIAEEFASQVPEVFERVISGFGSVSQDPVQRSKVFSKEKVLKELGIFAPVAGKGAPNQTIISGSAYYGFNHFADYWKRWKAIVNSRGDIKKLREIIGEPEEGFDWRDFSVIRLPHELLPHGFMDEKNLARAKATTHASLFAMEYGAIFCEDSDGFFKRSLIENCVVGKPKNPIIHPSLGELHFIARLQGDPGKKYVMGVDPASESDNFSIVILELWGDHRRIVYCWTTTRKRVHEKMKNDPDAIRSYYSFIAEKMRTLYKLFPCEHIAMDSQGGGIQVAEALGDPKTLRAGDTLLLPIPDPKNSRPSDFQTGAHIIELVEFASSDWVSEANHGMKRDFETRSLLFPEFDPGSLALAAEEDSAVGRQEDTLEDCVMEIEDLKDELATIVHTQTSTAGRDRWSTPEARLEGGKKGRMRKDRYSALLMANMAARILSRDDARPEYVCAGGFAHKLTKGSKGNKDSGPLYSRAPKWWNEQLTSLPGMIIKRK